NGDGTFTYTNEDDVAVTFDATRADITENGDGTYTIVDADGNNVTINPVQDIINNFEDFVTNNEVIVNGDTYNSVEEYLTTLIENNETVTTLVDNNDGTYTYTNEDNVSVIIDVPSDVITNIEQILGDINVLNELIEVLGDTYVGGNVYYDGTEFTYVDASGDSHVINFEEIVQANETVTSMTQDTATGVITYTDEEGDPSTVNVVSTDDDNQITVGVDGGAYYAPTVNDLVSVN